VGIELLSTHFLTTSGKLEMPLAVLIMLSSEAKPTTAPNEPSANFTYTYRTLSTVHLEELQNDINILRKQGKLSNHKTYRGYIENKKFKTPEKLPDAKSLIIMAIPTKPMHVKFHLNGKTHEVTLPPQYYDDGITDETIQEIIQQHIIKRPGFKLERTRGIHLKLTAVRSGLGKYGRNNLCYVEGMGSLLKLVAYFTDAELSDNWNSIEMMPICKNCTICTENCPNGCITQENFVINAGKCLSLYNEIEGKFPKWIKPTAHNTLIGCMKCQAPCPANTKAITQTGRLEDVTEEETRKILDGTPDPKLLETLNKKLKNFDATQSTEAFAIFTRNLKALLSTGNTTSQTTCTSCVDHERVRS
jgi:epoxyqueuosine reductase